MQVFGKAAQMRVLGSGDRFVSVRFGFAGDDPGFEFLRQLIVGHDRIDCWETHRLFAKLSESDGLATAGGLVPRELVAHVDAEVVHDHRDARRAGSVRAEDREEGGVRMVGVSRVIEKAGLFPLAPADVRFGGQLPNEPTIGRVNGDGFFVDVLALHQCLIATLGDSSEVMVDVVLGVPIVPMEVTIESFHVLATTDHERVRAIDVVRTIDAVADSLRRMFARVEVLAAEVRQSPIGRQFINVGLDGCGEIVDEAGVVFKDDVAVDTFEQTLFQDQAMRTVTSPRSVSGFPLRWRCTAAAVDGGEPLWLWERPWFRELAEPIFQAIVAAVEVDQEATLDNLSVTHDRRRPLARVRLQGTCVGIFGWRFGRVTWRQRG